MTAGVLLVVGADRDDLARRADRSAAPGEAGWASPSERALVRAWTERGWPDPNVVVAPGGAGTTIAAWGGWPIALGTRCAPHDLAAAIHRAAAADGPDRFDALRGTYGAVALDGSGVGRAFGDPLGLRPLYWGRIGTVLAAGTDVHRVAAVLANGRAAPARRPFTACALGAVGYRPPQASGYEDVRRLEPGAWIEVTADGRAKIVDRGRPWLQLDDLHGAEPAELLEVVRLEIGRGLETALALGDPVVELTGGKDSRLLLAALIELGVAPRVRFETAGLADLPDVQVASTIATSLGLRHESVFRSANVHGLPYRTLFDRFVERTGGMVSGWEARPIPDHRVDLRLSGLNGEALRTRQRIDPGHHRSPAERAAAMRRCLPTSALGLATPEYAAALEAAFERALEEVRAETDSDHDAVDTFHLQVRTPQRYGPLDEIQPGRRILPLSSLRAIRAAFALGGRRRHAEVIHHALIHRASPELAVAPFALDGWPDDLATFAPTATSAPARSSASPPTSPSTSTSTSTSARIPADRLMASLQRTLAPDRRELLHDLLADTTNPAWDLLDRHRAIDALERYDELRPQQRRELYGAASAAQWCGA